MIWIWKDCSDFETFRMYFSFKTPSDSNKENFSLQRLRNNVSLKDVDLLRRAYLVKHFLPEKGYPTKENKVTIRKDLEQVRVHFRLLYLSQR